MPSLQKVSKVALDSATSILFYFFYQLYFFSRLYNCEICKSSINNISNWLCVGFFLFLKNSKIKKEKNYIFKQVEVKVIES